MKRLVFLLAAALMLVACGGSGNSQGYDAKNVITQEEFMTFITEKDYASAEGKSVDFGGLVYMNSTTDEEFVYYSIQVEEDYGKEVVIKVAKGSETLKDGDFVKVSGYFLPKAEVEKIDDGYISFREVLVVEVDSFEKTDYQNAFAPTLKEYQLNLTEEQNGLKVTLEKIEFAEKETRLYVSADNGTDSKISIYSFDFVIIADGKNYEEARSNYIANYPDITTSLYAGTKTEGIVAYDAIDFEKIDGFKVIVDSPYSDNWDFDFEDFLFDITSDLLK